jgi:methyl-accepting chemotaxis protein
MFNRKLKAEIAALKEELGAINQTKASLDNEMLALHLDPKGVVTYANRNFEAEMCFQRADLEGKSLLELVPAYLRKTDFHLKLEKALVHGEHLAGALRLLRGNGTEAWLRGILQPIRSSGGKLLGFSFFANDLTRTITTSREHENIINALQRSTAVIEFNLDGTVLTANDRFLHSMGYTLDQIKGKHHRMFCEPEEYNSAAYAEFWQQLGRGNFIASRFKRVDSKGQVVWLEASYNPITDVNDRLYKVVKFATVITEKVLQEQAINDAAQLAHGISRNTDQSAQTGATVISQTVLAMQDLGQRMQDAVEGISELDAQSLQISSMIQSIREIADQTNLLALNAAIEAARAGEQGRGFAVVADEVRNLASRTTNATQEISGVVGQNRKLTESAVTLINAGKAKAEEGLSLAAQAGDVITDIKDGAQKVLNAVNQFASRLST